MGTVKYTGPVASFHCPTNAEIRSLKVHFSPKQEGSGDPSPENVRPISGWTGVTTNSSNKNMFDLNWMLLSSGTLVDGVLTDTAANLLNSFSESIKPIPNTRYNDCITISITAKTDASSSSTGRGFTIKVAYDDGTYSNLIYFSNSSTSYTTVSATSTSGKKVIALHCDYGSGGANIWNIKDFQVELSATATSYEPYHGSTTNYEFGVLGKNKFNWNVEQGHASPVTSDYTTARSYPLNTYIIGMSSSNYYRDNYTNWVLNPSISNGTISFSSGGASGYGIGYPLKLMPNQTYFLSGETTNNGLAGTIYYDKDGALISTQGNRLNKTITIPDNTVTTMIVFYSNATNTSYTFSNIQLELGSTATAYEPYDPNHTVYGGWVDLISGEVQQEYGLMHLNETNDWTGYAKTGVKIRVYLDSGANAIASATYAKVPGTSDKFISQGQNGFPDENKYCFSNTTEGRIFLGLSSSITSLEDFKTWFGNLGGADFAYELITPITYHLAPIELQTFLGQNNVWSNADYVEVEYDLHETQDILNRKNFIIANQPHIVRPAAAPLQNFVTDVPAPLKECKVHFAPVQDLHGYDKPWVGGSGKNLWNNENIIYGTWTASNGTVSAIKSGCRTQDIIASAGNTYTIFYNGERPYSASIVELDENKNFILRTHKPWSGASSPSALTVTMSNDTKYFYAQVYNIDTSAAITPEILATYKIQLEKDSIATSYEPYENICPISGWTGLEVTRCGKNFSTAATGTEMAQKWPIISSSRALKFSGMESGQEFTLSASFTKASEPSSNKRLYLNGSQLANSTTNSIFDGPRADEPHNSIIHNWVNENGEIWISHNNRGLTYNDDFIEYAASLQNIQFELGDTATTFEPYNGTTIPIDWSIEAGTVYGGYVDLVKGEIWKTWDIIDLGTCTWIQYSNNPSIFYTRNLKNLKEHSNQYTVLCTAYPYEQQLNVTDTNDKTINDSQQLNLGNVAIRDTNYAESTSTEFKEAMNGVICAYKLATPQLVTTLTPTQLKTLRGTNNIWSNANDNIEIAYWTH